MKITKIYTESYRWEKKKVYFSGRGKGSHAYRYNNLTILYVETDDGLTGIGTGMNIDKLPQFEAMLIGMDPLCIEGIYQKMTDPNNHGLKNCIGTIAAIDIALWDLKAKYARMPLYKLLGGVRNKVDCYVAGGYYMEGKTTLDLQHEMEEYIKDNARAVKMKVGGLSPYEDAMRVKAVREAIGPDVKLLVDANCAWRIHEALEFAKRAEEYNLFWFEEPLAAKDFDNYRKLSEHTSTPLAGGESLMIFPEKNAPGKGFLYAFQDKFVDTARFYYNKTGKAAPFVPVYVAPALKSVYIGKPTVFRPEAPIDAERERICGYLRDEITAMAEALPEHTVVPYRNIPKKDYPKNRKDYAQEKS